VYEIKSQLIKSESDSYPFVTEKIFLAVPKSHKFANRSSIQLIEASDEEFISLPLRNHFRQITDAFCKESGFIPQITCEVEEFSASSSFVQKEIGLV
jgi:DNA-binding transcriptional LysR family regulator